MGEPAEHPSLRRYLEEVLTVEQRQRIGLITFNHWSFAVGTVIETVLEARAMGSQAVVGFWADQTPVPDVGWRASRRLARLVGSATRDQQAQQALEAAGIPADSFVKPPIRHWRPSGLPSLPDPATRSAIRGLRYRGADLGPAILEVPPDDDTPIRENHSWPRRWVSAAIRSYAWAYDQAEALIRERDLRAVVVYNGRFTHDRAVAAAAMAAGIRILYYDTGGYQTDFDLTEATTHDWAHLQQRMLKMYSSWPVDERDRIGSSWFEDRRSHSDANNSRFTGIQQRGNVEGLPACDRLVVYFSSSGDEIAELDIDWEEFLHSQEAALAALANACRARPGTALVVRTHPHMRLKPAGDLEDWIAAVAAAAPDVHFGPESAVDSYALMDKADIVFTYGSTAGVEAAFFGRPVAVMGPSAYNLLGCATRVRSVDEIAACIDTAPAPRPREAIPYGLMMQRRGFSYSHAQNIGGDAIALAGVRVGEASTNALKLSDAWRRIRTWRLTRS